MRLVPHTFWRLNVSPGPLERRAHDRPQHNRWQEWRRVAANDAGEIVGYQMSPDDDALFHTVVWSGGRILDLKALGVDQKSFPNAINNKGQVVGISGNRSFDEVSLRAVISERGEPWVDLNTLILPNLGVQLRNATYINDRGEIAAIGAFPDGNHAPVLLVPSDDER